MPLGPVRLSRVAVVTRGRPELALRCLRSFGLNAKAFGRPVELALHDDSPDPKARADLRAALRKLGAELDLKVFYAGYEQKERYAVYLGGGEARFALFGEPKLAPAVTIGANRNSVLLDNAGRGVFMTDDDAVCRVARTPGAEEGLAETGLRAGIEYWFFPSRERTLAACPEIQVDLLGLHEKAMAETGAATTMNGYLGDGGASSRVYLHLRGPSRERLLASRETFETAIRTRECARGVRKLTVTEGAYFMGAFAGLDVSRDLPFFPPHGRGEDTVFGLLRAARGLKAAVLPVTCLHDPVPAREYPMDEPVSADLIINDYLAARIALRFDGEGAGRDPLERRHALRVEELESLLREFDGPDFWRRRVAQALENWRAALADGRRRCADHPDQDGEYVADFDSLERRWPAVLDNAQNVAKHMGPLSEPA